MCERSKYTEPKSDVNFEIDDWCCDITMCKIWYNNYIFDPSNEKVHRCITNDSVLSVVCLLCFGVSFKAAESLFVMITYQQNLVSVKWASFERDCFNYNRSSLLESCDMASSDHRIPSFTSLSIFLVQCRCVLCSMLAPAAFHKKCATKGRTAKSDAYCHMRRFM